MGAVSLFMMGDYHHQPKTMKYLYRYNKSLHHSVTHRIYLKMSLRLQGGLVV